PGTTSNLSLSHPLAQVWETHTTAPTTVILPTLASPATPCLTKTTTGRGVLILFPSDRANLGWGFSPLSITGLHCFKYSHRTTLFSPRRRRAPPPPVSSSSSLLILFAREETSHATPRLRRHNEVRSRHNYIRAVAFPYQLKAPPQATGRRAVKLFSPAQRCNSQPLLPKRITNPPFSTIISLIAE
ncbi:hypothetical protein V8G54_007415, partial [Vigna mungo]